MMFHLEGCSSRCFSCPLHGTGIDNHTHQDTLHWYIDIFDMYWYMFMYHLSRNQYQFRSAWYWWHLPDNVQHWMGNLASVLMGQNSNQSITNGHWPCWWRDTNSALLVSWVSMWMSAWLESCHRHGALRYSTHMCIWPSVHQRLYVLCIVYIKDCTHCDAMCTRDGGSHWQWHWPPEYQECDGSLAFF